MPAAECARQAVAAMAAGRDEANVGQVKLLRFAKAGLAAAITLTVVEPTSNGIGSDAYAILWDGQRLVGLNASGRSRFGRCPTPSRTRARPLGAVVASSRASSTVR